MISIFLCGCIAKSVGQNGTSPGQAGESVTRGDRRRRELEARRPSPPLACLPWRCEYRFTEHSFGLQVLDGKRVVRRTHSF